MQSPPPPVAPPRSPAERRDAALAPAAASAQNVGTLDAQAATPGHVGKVDPHPFTASVLRTFTASSKHTISARAFISEKHGRHASRTLRVSFLACS